MTLVSWQVWIRVGDSFIGNGAPFSVTIRAALTSAAKTSARLAGSAGALASGVETAITAGQTTKLIVTAYDIYGQRQVDANGTAKVADQFTVTFGPPTAADGGATFATWNLVDNKDGKRSGLLFFGGGQFWICYAWQDQKSI